MGKPLYICKWKILLDGRNITRFCSDVQLLDLLDDEKRSLFFQTPTDDSLVKYMEWGPIVTAPHGKVEVLYDNALFFSGAIVLHTLSGKVSAYSNPAFW